MEKTVICEICPRRCQGERTSSAPPGAGGGVCRMGLLPVLARAAAHFGEEPCISGTKGSGAVFFSGCPLGCVYCQNDVISRGCFGETVSIARLREIFLELAAAGVHNINLVTPTHFAAAIGEALAEPLPLPVVYNTSGYERVETLRELAGKIQIYLPDFKYAAPELALRYSRAGNYPEAAEQAILEMFRQVGRYRLGEDGLLQSGVLIRHLVLPGNLDNTKRVIDWLCEHFQPGEVLFSLMGQYTPCGNLSGCPELRRTLTPEEYAAAEEYLWASGWEDGYVQDLTSACTDFIPAFDLTGVRPKG